LHRLSRENSDEQIQIKKSLRPVLRQNKNEKEKTTGKKEKEKEKKIEKLKKLKNNK
jgi:hypothetical protein